ncbi:MAG: VWA domain-containing protein [Gammaproteobacteria bacterium]|nr:VWA domain-containing protein [Gammaproteobacteria bacterium]
MKKLYAFILSFLVLFLTACSEPTNHSRAVYMLLDTSGTYTKQLEKAQGIVRYLLGVLNSGDSLALARVDSASFSEKDIVAKVTFDLRPSQANAQKRAFMEVMDKFAAEVKGSSYTDITGGMLQAIEYLNETGAGEKHILIFSDLKEEIKKGHIRDFPIPFDGVKVVALNVTKLHSDNVDPREYMERVDNWSKRVEDGGGSWRVINDLERLSGLLE